MVARFIGAPLIRRTLRDTYRLYRNSWWRLSLIVLIVGVLCTLAVWLVAKITTVVAGHLHGVLLSHGRLKTSGELEFTVGVALAIALFCVPIALAGVGAVARITDQVLAGRRPRLWGSFALGLRRAPRLLFGGLAALVGLVVLLIVTPALFVVGVLGLAATPLIRRLGRRWPRLSVRWPSVHTLGLMAIPFALPAIWLARTALLVPSATLNPGHTFRRLLRNAHLGRAVLIVSALIGSVVAALAIEAAFTWVAFMVAGDNGRLVGQALAQFIALGLPIVVLTVVYRLEQSASGGTPLPPDATGPYGVGAEPERPAFLASVTGDPASLATPWRLRHRRVAFCMPIVIIAGLFVVAGPSGSASAGEGGPLTTPGGSVTLVVNSAADDIDTASLTAETANCLSGSGTCTLRAALLDAASLSGGGVDGSITIAFATDLTIGVDPSGPLAFANFSDSLYSGLLTIDGLGHRIILDGGSAGQVLVLTSPTWNFELKGVEIRNGSATTAGSADGGGLIIGGAGTSTVERDTFDHNLAGQAGGAILSTGTLLVENSTFFENTSQLGSDVSDYPSGGADLYSVHSVTTATNDTFSESHGGSVFALNSSAGATLVVNNSLFAIAVPGNFDCSSYAGGGISGVDNVVTSGDTSCPGLIAAPSGSPTVGAFQVVGSGTPPVLPLSPSFPGNPANAAVGAAGNDGVACPATDERGQSRPGSGCDAGAYQYDPATTTSVNSSENPSAFGDPVVFTALVTLANDVGVPRGTVQFSIDGAPAGTAVTLDGNGNATFVTSTLSAGAHDVTAAFTSELGASYSDSTTTAPFVQTVDVSGSNVAVASSLNPAPVGSTVTFTVTVSGSSTAPTGTVSLTDTSSSPATVIASASPLDGSGHASIATSTLPLGTQLIVAKYSGDSNNAPGTSATFSQDIQTSSTVSITPSLTTTRYGVPDVFTVSVPTTAPGIVPTGQVQITYDPGSGLTSQNVQLNGSGNGTLVINTLPAGSDSVSATYLGDTVYAPSSATSASVTIVPAATTTTETPLSGSVSYGTPVVLTAVVTDTSFDSVASPDGTVVFSTSAGILGIASLTAGSNDTASASYTTTEGQLPLGGNDVTATYVSSSNFEASASAASTLTVTPALTAVSLTSNANPSLFGQTVSLVATVSATGGSTATPHGSVTFSEGLSTLGTVTVASGVATLGDGDLTVGTHSIMATFTGTANFAGSASTAFSQTVDISPSMTALTVTPEGATATGRSLRLDVVVSPSPSSAAIPGGTVTLTDDGTALTTLTLSGGAAEFGTTANVATHTYVATYQGSADFSTSSDTQIFTVARAPATSALGVVPTSSVFGDPVTLTDTVSASNGGDAAPTGSVTFGTGGVTLGVVTLVPSGPMNSTATLTTTALPESAFNPRGQQTITASFDGGTSFVPSSASAVDAVTQGTTAVSLQAGPASVGTPTTLTATIAVTSGAGAPTGTVDFTDSDGRNLGFVTVSGGQAVLNGVLFPVGDDVVTATYTSGDFNFVAGAPATLHLAVGQGTPTIGVTATVAGPVYGQGDDLIATVSVGNGPAPTGTVTFSATGPGGTVALGMASLSGSGPATAELHPSATPIPVGSLTITASYAGDGNYMAGTATTAAPTVTTAGTVTSVSSSANPSVVHQGLSFTATVTDPATGVTPTGSVTFAQGTTELSTVALNSAGHATITLIPGSSGAFALHATYLPGRDFSGSSGSVTQTVDLLPSDVTLRSNTDAVQSGQSITFTATVQATNLVAQYATGAPTGTVNVSDGHGNGCIITLGPQTGSNLSFGSCQASWTTTGLVSVNGAYSGDTQFAPGTSPGLGLLIGQLMPTISLTSSPSQWVTGESITFSWTVTGPTVADGPLRLIVNTTTVCTTTALVGSCTYTFPANARGGADATISYGGDAAWQSTSASLDQTVAGCVPFNAPTVSPPGAGTVTVVTQPNCDGGTGYIEGTNIALLETPGPDYSFQEWLDTGSSSFIENLTAIAPGPDTDIAIFDAICVSLTLSTRDLNAAPGTITSSLSPNCGPFPRDWQYTASGRVGSFAKGTVLTLTAVPPAPASNGVTQAFDQWFGDVPAAELLTPSITVTMTGSLSIEANFGTTCFHNITFPAPAGGTATLSPPNCDDASGPGYAQFSTATVSTKALGSQYFVHWSNNVAPTATTANSSTGTVVITKSGMTISASYGSCISFTVSENGNGPDGNPLGSVSANPAGNCPTLGAGWYTAGSTVDINATSFGNTDGIFNGWVGETTQEDPSFASNYLHIQSSGTETANFYYGAGCQVLTTGVVPAGSATIAAVYPYGNNCPAGMYDDTVTPTGSPIQFTATATSGHPILGWTAATTVEGRGYTYGPQDYNGQVGATFNATFLGPSDVAAWVCEGINPTVTLISPNGTSHTGPSPSNADFIDASPAPDCPLGPLDYTVGTLVSPAANAPNVGYTFLGWSGAETGSAITPSAFALDGSVSGVNLNAKYQVICHTLTSNFSEGVSAAPPPNCPDTPASANEYIGGTTVTLQETGKSGDDFSGWTGNPSGTSGSFAYTTMTADTSIYADYTAKSVGEKISDAFTSAGNEIAITAKKVTGVVAAVASGLLLGLNPVTGIAGALDVVGLGVTSLLKALGVSGSGLDALNLGLDDVAETLTMLTAAISCGTVWSANANTTNNALQDANGQIGNSISSVVQARDATQTADEELAAQEAKQQAAAETQYGLTGAPVNAVAEEASSVGKGVTFVSKYGSRLGVVGAVAAGIYSEATSGPNVGWDSSATAAWTGGADVYNSCINASEPSYMGGAPPSSTSPSGE